MRLVVCWLPSFCSQGQLSIWTYGCPQMCWRMGKTNRAMSSVLDGENQEIPALCLLASVLLYPTKEKTGKIKWFMRPGLRGPSSTWQQTCSWEAALRGSCTISHPWAWSSVSTAAPRWLGCFLAAEDCVFQSPCPLLPELPAVSVQQGCQILLLWPQSTC